MLSRCTTCTRMSILSQASQTVECPYFLLRSSFLFLLLFFRFSSFFFKKKSSRSFSASLAYRVGCNHLHSSVSQTTRFGNPQPPSTNCNNPLLCSFPFSPFLSCYILFFLHFAVCLSLLFFYSISLFLLRNTNFVSMLYIASILDFLNNFHRRRNCDSFKWKS